MKFNLTLFSLLVLLLTVSCRESVHISNIPENVKVINADPSEIEKVHFDSLFHNVMFVRLEVNQECLIEKAEHIIVTDEKIIVLSSSETQEVVFIFDKQGNYLSKIDSRGRGPGEYMGIRSIFVNPDKQHIGVLDAFSKVFIYDYSGNFVSEYSLAPYLPGFSTAVWFKGLYYTLSHIGQNDEWRGAPDNTEYNVVGIYDSQWSLVAHDYPVLKAFVWPFFSSSLQRLFISTGNSLYYSHPYSEIIYEIDSLTFVPRYYIDYGQYALSGKEKLDYASSADIGSVNEFLKTIEGKRVFPGGGFYTISDEYIIHAYQIHGKWDNYVLLYSIDTDKAIQVDFSRAVADGSVVYPAYSTLQPIGNRFFGYINPDDISRWNQPGFRNWNPAKGNSFSTSNFNEPDVEGNGILVFFDIRH